MVIQFRRYPTPIGVLWLYEYEGFLIRIEFDNTQKEGRKWFRRVFKHCDFRETTTGMEQICLDLHAWFNKAARVFDAPHILFAPEFHKRVLHQLRRIDYGAQSTYHEIAEQLDSPNAARAVGNACNFNPLPILYPCHRVLGADGSLVGYAGGLTTKQFLLDFEGGAGVQLTLF